MGKLEKKKILERLGNTEMKAACRQKCRGFELSSALVQLEGTKNELKKKSCLDFTKLHEVSNTGVNSFKGLQKLV